MDRWVCLLVHVTTVRVKRVLVISVHFVVVTKSIVETAMDDLFACESTLQLFLETFRLLNEQDTTMTFEFVLQLCDD